MMIRFAVRLAWRETRAAWRHFAGFLACVALGVAALVAVSSFAAGLDRTLAREAKALMGGDVEIRSARPLTPAADERLDAVVRDGATLTRVTELVAMARHPGRGTTLLVELKAVEPAYPLYGQLDTSPPGTRVDDEQVLVQAALLERLGLALGERLAIGEAEFTITGLVDKEPDRGASVFTLGPRVLLSPGGLARTALVQHGSRVRYRALIRLPGSEAAATRAALARDLADPALRIAAFDEAQPGLRRFFDQLTTYLRLVGLASLGVGGIGVAAGVRTFLRRKIATIAILKVLGAGSRTLLAAYLSQALALGGLGSLVGAGLGTAVQALLVPLLGAFLPFVIEPRLEPAGVLAGLGVGLLVTLLCALWPLLGFERSRPPCSCAIPSSPPNRSGRGVRGSRESPSPRRSPRWPSGRPGPRRSADSSSSRPWPRSPGSPAWPVGARRLVQRIPPPRSLAWRQGLASLNRPGSQAVGVSVALGVGVMLLVAMALLESSLGRQLDLERRREAPSFFFVDIQPDQVDAFRRTLAGAVDGRAEPAQPSLVPVVRARLAAIDGAPIVGARWEGRDDAWRVRREYVLTFAAEAPEGTVVTRGRWWTPAEARARPRVSVEDETARALGVDVGGTLAFDVQGVKVEAEVMSLRKVDWQTLSANFFVIFSPGPLDDAPLAYLATARVPAALEGAVQTAVVAALPNVTAIPIRDVLERVSGVLDRIGVAIRVIAAFVLGAGVMVMAGALTQSRAQRTYEAVLLKTLGATRGRVARAFAVEYGCLGLVAGLGGTALGALLAAVVLRLVLDAPGGLDPRPLAVGPVATVVLALAVGFLGTFRLLRARPLPILRQE